MIEKARHQKKDLLKFHVFSGFLIFIGIAITYGHTLHYPFQFDDHYLIVQNDSIHVSALSWRNIAPVLMTNRPVASLSYAVNFYFNGLETGGFHFVNFLIHFLTTLIIYFVFNKTLALLEKEGKISEKHGSKEAISLLGALLWAVHPVQTQAVTYIIQRMASLAAFFCLLSLFLYIVGCQNKGKISIVYYGLSVLSLFMAFGTKENTLMFPIVILLYDLFFISRFKINFLFRQVMILMTLLAVLIFGLIWVVWIHQGAHDGFSSLLTREYGAGEMNPVLRVMTEWRVLIYYLTLLLFPDPARMNLDHDFSFSHSLFNPMATFWSLLAVLSLIGFAVWKAKKHPLVSFSILWFFINLTVESTFLKLDLVFEHRLYLPSVMVFLPFSVMIFYFGGRFEDYSRQVTLTIGVTLICLLAYLTYERNQVWKTEVSLWSDVVSKSPHKIRSLIDLGDVYLKDGNFQMATQTFQEALRLNKNIPMAHNDLGYIAQIMGNNPLAIQEFQEAIRLTPDFPEPHFNLGNIYLSANQNNLAIEEFNYLVKLNPAHAKAHTYLGILYHKQGDLPGAQKEFEEAVRLSPKSSFCQYNYAYFLEVTDKKKEAIEHYQEALRWAGLTWLGRQKAIPEEMIRQKLKGLSDRHG